MGHMTARGWGDKEPPHISSGEYVSFRQRCGESHAVRWHAMIDKWDAAGHRTTLADDIPIVGGTLTLDSSDIIRRQLTLEVGGADEWAPNTADSPLAPFGQILHLSAEVDRGDGTWFPWFKVFEGPIRENVYERPSQITTLQCSDRGSTLHEYLHVRRKGYGNRPMVNAISQMADAALVHALYDVEASAGAYDIDVDTFVADAGQSRLEAANELAALWGYEVWLDWNGDLIIRKDLTDEDDNAWDPSEAGGDIGYVANPVAAFRDASIAPGGNLLGVTQTLTRDGAVNGVAVNVTALRKPRASDDLHWWHLETAGGSVEWGDVFGRIPFVPPEITRHKLTDAFKARQVRRAKRLLKRRRGLTKYLDFDSLPLYWAEPDDKVSVTVDGVQEDHYLQRIEFDLAGGPMRCRTRVLTTPNL